ncbi:MAG TPA: sugar transferase, partial [Sumerlaeia bacterium]|nr:sugar transferase [Sumerlaeia bacterium]
TSIVERTKYDLYYIENWSILFDIKVLLLTVVWMARRIRQLMTLPPDHPALRRSEDLPVDGGSPERGE